MRVHDTRVMEFSGKLTRGLCASCLSVTIADRQEDAVKDNTQVPGAVRDLAEKLGQPRPMRRGSLGERFIKCGKERCACATDDLARHGPYFSLTRSAGGRTRSRRLTAEQAERARDQLAAGQEFRRQVEAYWQACERWADAELEGAAAEEAEKRGSKGASKPRSSPRSRRS